MNGKGLQAESVEALAKSFVLKGQVAEAAALRRTFAQGGHQAVLRWQMETARAKAEKSYVSPVVLASLSARMGRREDALAQLDQGYKERATALLWIQDDPAFDSLHDEDRYQLIARRVGLPPAYLGR